MIPLLWNIPDNNIIMRWTCKGLKIIVGHVHLEHVDTVVGINCYGVDIRLDLKITKKIFILWLKVWIQLELHSEIAC